MQHRQLGDQPSVGLLRKGIKEVVGAQTRLDMAHGQALVEGRQGTGKGRGGVPLDQDEVGPELNEFLAQPFQRCGGDVGEGLVGCHQFQVPIRLDGEQVHHLADHLAVLTGEDHPAAEVATGLEGPNHGGHFDGFRTRAQNKGD